MSNRLTKYLAASAITGAMALGGYSIAGAQDGGSTTTTNPPATQGEVQPPPHSGERPDAAQPEGSRPGCNHQRNGEAGPDSGTGSAPQTPQAPQTESSSTQSSFTST